MLNILKALLIAVFAASSWAGTLEDWIAEHSSQPIPKTLKRQVIRSTFYHSMQNNIDPMLMFALIQTESSFQPNAKSVAGARGLTQVIPRYHREKIRKDPIHDVDTNIRVGAEVLAEYLKQTRSVQAALRKYNGSSGNKYPRKVLKTRDALNRYLNKPTFASSNQPLGV